MNDEYRVGYEDGHNAGFVAGRNNMIEELINDGLHSLREADDEFVDMANDWTWDHGKDPHLAKGIKDAAMLLYACLVTFRAVVMFYKDDLGEETYINYIKYTDETLDSARMFRIKYALDLGEV